MKVRTIALMWLLASVCGAQARMTREAAPLDSGLGISTLPLWPDGAPGAKGTGPDDQPALTVFDVPRPPQPGATPGSSPRGAVIISPGGGYVRLATNLEGRQPADWFAAHGIVAFVLHYRLGARYPFPIPLEDEQRAIRLVRSRAQQFGIRPDRIAVMGFSAGGHLAALAGTDFDAGQPDATDPVERESSRPDLMILAYPWINAMQPSIHGMITYCSLIPATLPAECARFEHLYTPSEHVRANSPPTFLFATTDDAVVPVSASIDMYSALQAKGIDAELHIFRHGAHGSGLGKNDPALEAWPSLLDTWLRAQWPA